MPHRFYVPQEFIAGEKVTFSDEQRKQITNVLRLTPGDLVNVFDGTGREYSVQISSPASGDVLAISCPQTESPLHVTIIQSLPKGDKIEFIVQKCTEIGVSAFLIMETSRSVPRIAPEKMASRLHRWQSIAVEAAEQSGRVRVPLVSGIVSFANALDQTRMVKARLIACEAERSAHVSPQLLGGRDSDELAILIGPEGGFGPEETEAARESGVIPISLGPGSLRTETAAVVASALAILGWRKAPDVGGAHRSAPP